MALQAFVDDSGSQNQHPALILAGYIAPAEKWAAFSDEWEGALAVKPKLDYFKMNEAVRLNGQFRGWDGRIRDERLRHLRRLIEEHALTYVACVVPFDAYRKAVQTLPYKIKMTPHGAAILLLMGAAKRYRSEMGLNERVDFIFDDQVMEKTRLIEGWDEISAEIDPVERDFVSRTPIFRDDKDLKPLQAADMIAWLERNRWEQRFGVKAYEPPWIDPKDPVDGLTFIFDEGSLARVFQRAHDHAIAEINEKGWPS